MKQQRHPDNGSRPLLDPWRFPEGAQTGPTASREKVREQSRPVRSPRQSKRRVEKSG
jgi:hypothetical protein